MVSFHQLARKNRQRNAGGCYPDALPHAVTLAILLRKLARESPHDRPGMTVVALFLWLTQAWSEIKNAKDIPDFIKISGSTPCREHTFRTYYDGSLTWSEYALAYENEGQRHFLWQPIPTYLNAFFQPFISKLSYEVPFLKPAVKQRLFTLMEKKWKTPEPLRPFPRVRKDRFHHYLIDCALADNTLTATPRTQLVSPNRHHHKSATSYQQLDSDRVRYKVFEAHNRYLSRLIHAARDAQLQPHFELYLKNYSVNLITEHTKLASYLSQSGRIGQFVLDTENGRKINIRSPAIRLGSKRYLDEMAVVQFFNQLAEQVGALKPRQAAAKSQWLSYYNAATSRIALLFILLTGVRPNHSISILTHYYSGEDMVFVKDKGRLRPVLVCDHLQQEIKHYQALQSSVLSLWTTHSLMDELWFYLDEQGNPYPLSNRALRHFMHQHWIGVVPYQLRHFFAQSAISHQSSTRLHDQDVDRLMGHSNLGEHLGSDQIFPATFEAMKAYLNQLPQRLGLKDIVYV